MMEYRVEVSVYAVIRWLSVCAVSLHENDPRMRIVRV